MGDAERQVMEQRLTGMTQEQKDRLLLELAEGMRAGDDDQGRGRVQSAEAILALRPKVEVWTLMPRTGRVDKRPQDRKVWDTPGVMDPYANEDQPDRPQIIKVIDLRDGTILFERETVLGQPQPGQPVAVGGQQPGQALVQQHMMGPVSDDDLAARMVGLLKSNPDLRRAVVEMADELEDANDDAGPAAEPAGQQVAAARRRPGRPPKQQREPEPAGTPQG
jgi:hypothetical protein